MILLIDELSDHEGSLVDFANMEGEAESIVECIHKMAYKELLSRSIESMWDWQMRTKNMFEHNALHRMGDVVSLSLGGVNRLMGCGYVTRKEVYEVFCVYHLKLKHWMPELHWEKMNYKF